MKYSISVTPKLNRTFDGEYATKKRRSITYSLALFGEQMNRKLNINNIRNMKYESKKLIAEKLLKKPS